MGRLSGKAGAEPGADTDTDTDTGSPESTAAAELGAGAGTGAAAADEVTSKVPGRDADGLRDGFPAEGKCVVSEVKGGSAENTGVMGAEDRGLETLKGARRPGRPGSAGLRQVGRVTGTEADVYA